MKLKRGGFIEIKQLKKQLKITNDDIALKLGITKQSVINKIYNKTDWSLIELIKLTEMLKQVSDEPLDIQVKDKIYSVKITENTDK